MSAESGFRRGCRLRVVRQREVPINDSDFVAVSILDLLQGRTDPGAVRSLKVRILDDGHLCVRRPLHPLAIGHDDRDTRRLE